MAFLRKVLIVDDAPINRRILAKILARDYSILEAENGQAALELLQNCGTEVSLILLDVIMPVMDGYTLLAHLKADKQLSRIPVIVVTQMNSPEDEVQALTAGANDFVTKPYNAEVIRHRVNSLITLQETAATIRELQYDRLTGVFSKEFFYRQVEALLAQLPGGDVPRTEGADRAESVEADSIVPQYDIVAANIISFKLINDVFGTEAGDALLQDMAHALQVNAQSRGGFCGRLIGDMFAMILPHRDHYKTGVFEQELQAMRERNPQYNLNIKFGVYVIHDPTVSINAMCDRALMAINTIKDKYGVILAYYDDSLRQRMLTQQLILDNMEAGISERQFVVYFQPKKIS